MNGKNCTTTRGHNTARKN